MMGAEAHACDRGRLCQLIVNNYSIKEVLDVTLEAASESNAPGSGMPG